MSRQNKTKFSFTVKSCTVLLCWLVLVLPAVVSAEVVGYSENFDSATVGDPGTLPTGWQQVAGDNSAVACSGGGATGSLTCYDWQVHTGATPSVSPIGPDADHTTGSGNYLYVEDSTNSNGTVSLWSPVLEFTGSTEPTIEFYLDSDVPDAFSTAENTLFIDVYDAGGVTLLGTILQMADTDRDEWIPIVADLSSFIGSGSVRLQFRWVQGPSLGNHDIAIDDFRFFDAAVTTSTGPATSATYFIPIPEDQALQSLASIYTDSVCQTSAGDIEPENPVTSYISISIAQDGIVIYYDHHEDGFESATNQRSQGTTEIWGDGDLTNGIAPGQADDMLDAGDVIILNNPVDTNTLDDIVDFDGGDKISATGNIAVSRAAWGGDSSTLLAGAVEMYPTYLWGTSYTVPVGQSTDVNEMFQYTGAVVMASVDGTVVTLPDSSTVTLDAGESHLIDGGLNAGGSISATNPVQVQLLTGDVCANFESRWYNLLPTAQWDDNYYSPVATCAADPTVVHLYNPNGGSISVSWETSAGTQTPVAIAAGGTATVTLPAGEGARFFTTDGSSFNAIATVDSDTNASNNQTRDWGFTLISETNLSSELLVGWGDGDDPTFVDTNGGTAPNEGNHSPIWVQALFPSTSGSTGTITYCVDYNGDGGGNTDPNTGRTYDASFAVDPLDSTKITDPDGDNSAMQIFICDGSDALLTGAWGQACTVDGVTSPIGTPALDLGTSLINLATFDVTKESAISNDVNDNGFIDVGDTLTYTITVANSSSTLINANTLTVTDVLQAEASYVASSTQITDTSGTSAIADDAVGATVFPLDESGYLYPSSLAQSENFVITFNVTVNALPSSGILANQATAAGGATVTATVEDPVNDLPDAVDDAISVDEDSSVNIPVVANDDFGADGASSGDITLPDGVNGLTQPANGTVTLVNGGDNDPTNDQILYTPNPDFNGTDTFQYQICDSNGDCDTATVTVTVDPVNDPPVANDDSGSTQAGSPITIDVPGNDTDLDGNLDLTSVNTSCATCSDPANGSISIDPVTGEITYTPNPGFTGPDTFVYEICDTGTPILCDTATVTVTVLPNPDVIIGDASVTEGGDLVFNVGLSGPSLDPITITFSTTDGTAVDPDDYTGQTVQVTFAPGDTSAQVVVPTLDDAIFEPDETMLLAVASVDAGGVDDSSDTGTGTITDNEPTPQLSIDDVTVIEGTDNFAVFTVTTDTIASEDITVDVVTSDGSANAGGDYTTTTVTVTIPAGSSTGTVSVPILDDNFDEPNENFFVDLSNAQTSGGTPVGIADGQGEGTIIDDEPFAFMRIDDVTVTEGVNPVATFTITLDSALQQDVTVDVTVTDGSISSTLDDAVAGQDYTAITQTVTIPSGSTSITVDIPIIDDNIDELPEVFTVNLDNAQQVPSGTLVNIADDDGLGTIIDNDAPDAVDDSATTPENTPVDIPWDDNDALGTTATLDSFTQPSNGTVTSDDGGTPNDPSDDTFTYTPDPGFSGTDTFTYTICNTDVPQQCDTATVTVTVTDEGSPDAVDDAATTDQDTAVDIPWDDNDDFTDDALLDSFTQPANGTVTSDDGGTPNDPSDDTFTYTPEPGFNGTDTFTYTICDDDPTPTCDTATVTVTVNPNTTVGVDDFNNTLIDTEVSGNVLTNDFDVEGDGQSVTGVEDPASPGSFVSSLTTVPGVDETGAPVADAGDITIASDGSYTFIPTAGFTGVVVVTYQVCDDRTPGQACDTAELTIEVLPEPTDANDPPVANTDAVETEVDTPVTIDVLSNDFDPDGDPLTNPTIVTPPGNGSVMVNPDGTVTYTPNPGFTGVDTFEYETCDPSGLCDTAVVTVTILEDEGNITNATDDAANTTEDVPVSDNVLTNDTDPEGDGQTVNTTPLSGPSNGTVTLLANGDYTYTPNTGFVGNDEFVYEVCDDGTPQACDQATVYITVVDEGDPDAVDDTATTVEESPVDIPWDDNDTLPDGSTLDSFTQPSNGTVTSDDGGTPNDPSDDTFTYTPDDGFVGTDTFTYTVCDDDTPPSCDTATVTVTVTDEGSPDAVDDSATTPEDAPVDIPWDDNDDFTDDALLDSFTQPSNGTVTSDDGGTPNDPSDDTFTYTPDTGFSGTDTFTYTICDDDTPTATCDTATVTVTVTDEGSPDAVDDSATTTEDTAVDVPWDDNDSLIDGALLDSFTQPSNGTVTSDDGGTPNDPSDDTFTYTPNTGFAGTDTFTYTICDDDPIPTCDTATVTVTVNDEGNPDAVDDSATVPEDGSVDIPWDDNDDFTDGALLDSFTQPSNGTVTSDDGGTPNDPSDDTFTYTPDTGFSGTDTFTYTICDDDTPTATCDTATVTVTVTDTGDPDAVDDTATTDQDTAVDIPWDDNDDFTDDALLDSFTQPANGTVTSDDGGTPNDPSDDTFTYTPEPGFNGTDTFTYTICDDDPTPTCDTATVTVTVNPNTTVGVDDFNNTLIDTEVSGNVLTNDFDVEGDGQSVTGVEDPASPGSFVSSLTTVPGVDETGAPVADAGDITIASDGSYTFIPTAGFTGVVVVTYQVCDDRTPGQACDTAELTIEVLPEPTDANDPPVANTDAVETEVDTPVTIDVLSNDFDPDGDPLTNPTIVTPPGNGSVMVNPDGTVTYTPNPGFTGVDTFEYETCDPSGLCDTAVVTVTILEDEGNITNATDDAANTTEDVPVSDNVLTNDTDPEGDGQTVNTTPLSGPSNGTVTLLANGDYTYTPNTGFVGNDEFVYEVCDDGTPQACDQATVYITVVDEGDPDAVDDTATTVEESPVDIPWDDNDTLPDGSTLDSFTQPTNGTVTSDDGGTPNDPSDDTFTYTPDDGFVGTDTFTYTVCDDDTPPSCDTATVTVTVTDEGSPDAVDDSATTPEDAPVDIPWDDNDDFTDDALLDSFTQPSNGTVTSDDGGTPNDPSDDTFTYTPDTGFDGTDTFTYTICDDDTPTATCDTATVTVTVTDTGDPDAVDDSATTDQDMPVDIPWDDNDTLIDGATLDSFTQPTNGTVTSDDGGTPNDPSDDTFTYTPDPGFSGTDSFTYTVCDDDTPPTCDTATVTVTVDATSVRLQLRVMLQGALIGVETAMPLLMRDDLRSEGVLQADATSEPYTALPQFTHVNGGGGETVANPVVVFADNGADSIVDWVFVELRDSAAPATVVATRAGLVQRDGDVVDVDGTSALEFTQSFPGNYYVAVRHRNHIGTMTATAIALTATGTLVDFTDTSIDLWHNQTSFDGFEQKAIGGQLALWAGNTNTNDTIVFAGQNTDVDPIFNDVTGAPGNFFGSLIFVYRGYHLSDVDLSGESIFAGQNNDVDHIFNNVTTHPRNFFASNIFVIAEQLAQ